MLCAWGLCESVEVSVLCSVRSCAAFFFFFLPRVFEAKVFPFPHPTPLSWLLFVGSPALVAPCDRSGLSLIRSPAAAPGLMHAPCLSACPGVHGSLPRL